MAKKLMNIRILESKRAKTSLRNHSQKQNKNYMYKWLEKLMNIKISEDKRAKTTLRNHDQKQNKKHMSK